MSLYQHGIINNRNIAGVVRAKGGRKSPDLVVTSEGGAGDRVFIGMMGRGRGTPLWADNPVLSQGGKIRGG